MTPAATPITLATTMSTTRHRHLEVREGRADVDVDVCIDAPSCAGMIRIRFDGRSVDPLPLSPAHRTPVVDVPSIDPQLALP
jgi:hypothetical protein